MAGELTNEETSWLIIACGKQTTERMPASVLTRLLRLGLLEQKVGGPGISEAGREWLERHGHLGRRQPS